MMLLQQNSGRLYVSQLSLGCFQCATVRGCVDLPEAGVAGVARARFGACAVGVLCT